jgi:hypothetical protein
MDSMIVQYIADYFEYIMSVSGILSEDDVQDPPTKDMKLLTELQALGRLFYLEQLGRDWCIAAPPYLLKELRQGRPTPQQLEAYQVLETSWEDSGWLEAFPLDVNAVEAAEKELSALRLSDPDRLHLAQAKMLNAAWFLTNDSEIVQKCQDAKLQFRVRRPSECLDEISVGLFLEIP